MNYRHAYHAGNFADVTKHVVLTLLLKSLHKKTTPFFYLDTHAGAGRYDLASEAAQKTSEYHAGIQLLWDTVTPPELAEFLAVVRAQNPTGSLRYYPGSPAIAQHFLRQQDRMVLLERRADECAQLQSTFAGYRQVTVRAHDGYSGLKAFLPPKERRGLVLIDPPYESDNEYEQVVAGLRDAHERWASGIYIIWYPIKNRPPVARLHRAVIATGIRKILLLELCPYPDDTVLRLNGCGMIVVNPPWMLEAALQALLPKLLELLRAHSAGRSRLAWLVPE